MTHLWCLPQVVLEELHDGLIFLSQLLPLYWDAPKYEVVKYQAIEVKNGLLSDIFSSLLGAVCRPKETNV